MALACRALPHYRRSEKQRTCHHCHQNHYTRKCVLSSSQSLAILQTPTKVAHPTSCKALAKVKSQAATTRAKFTATLDLKSSLPKAKFYNLVCQVPFLSPRVSYPNPPRSAQSPLTQGYSPPPYKNALILPCACHSR